MAITHSDLIDIDPAACARLRDLVKGPFQKHLPRAVLEKWITDEFNQIEIRRLLVKEAAELVAQIRDEEGLPKDSAADY